MHWVPCIAALGIGACAGYMLHTARARMLTAREKADMLELRRKLSEAVATVEAVNKLILRRQAQQMPRPHIVPRPPQETQN